jgi:spore coat protein CotH
MIEERKVLNQFDTDGDKRLNSEERAAAREFLKKNPPERRGGPRGGPPGGGPPGFNREENTEPPKPGPRVSPADVPPSAVAGLYAPNSLRTLFLDFTGDDWETELQDFHGTDVEVPALLTVDGVKYPGVGVHFRGMSSYMMVRAGQKRSFNISLDFTDKKQRLDSYKTLNLLNSHDDDTFLCPVLYSHIARQFIPAPKANFVRVVVNGESWGVFVNEQQFNKDFVEENFRTGKGARWKVRGSPGANSGLDYIGDDLAEYKKHYDMKSGDKDDWQALITLCRTLSQTPPDQLQAALAPLLDLDATLWFLALDNALINGDGYWVRASDYTLYRDTTGKFHVIPADMNEAFRPPGGPGFGRGPGRRRGPDGPDGPGGPDRPRGPESADKPDRGDKPEAPGNPGNPGGAAPFAPVKGVELDPLVGLDDLKKPLRSRLLAVPSLRARYLAHVRTIAEEWLDWSKLGPLVAQYRTLLEPEIAADTRKLSTLAAFQKTTSDTPEAEPGQEKRHPGSMNLRAFADQRRTYLLSHTEPEAAGP